MSGVLPEMEPRNIDIENAVELTSEEDRKKYLIAPFPVKNRYRERIWFSPHCLKPEPVLWEMR